MSSDKAEFTGALLRISCLEVVIVHLLKAVLDKDPEMVNCINDIKAKLETIDSDVIDKLEGYGAEEIATIKEHGKSIEKIMTDAGL